MKTITRSSEQIYQHPYFTAFRESYQLPSGKIVDPYYFVAIPDSVTALCITKEKEVLFIQQYRHPVGEVFLELPGGFMDAGEDMYTAIQRELMEETGFHFEHIEYLTTTFGNPGALKGATHLFLATEGIHANTQQLDENEEITLQRCSIEAAKEKLLQGEIKQSMHALCMFHAFHKLNLSL